MTFSLLVFAIDKEIFAGKASSIIVPGENGELQILAGHTPVISKLKAGDVIIDGEDKVQKKIPIRGGVLEVKLEEVVVLVHL